MAANPINAPEDEKCQALVHIDKYNVRKGRRRCHYRAKKNGLCGTHQGRVLAGIHFVRADRKKRLAAASQNPDAD